MRHKNTLSIRYALNKQVVCIEGSRLSFVDDYFYKEALNEDVNDEKNTNFPIKMQALRVDWIIDESGKKFLKALAESENEDLFRCKTTIVIIEYLYKNYRKSVL